ncbi:MAG: hypothetical protein NVSMB31_11670 [Vulcanimicrobiaceae bacterium]
MLAQQAVRLGARLGIRASPARWNPGGLREVRNLAGAQRCPVQRASNVRPPPLQPIRDPAFKESSRPVMTTRVTHENADTVSLICALLVRFPEIASVRSISNDGNVRFTFVVSQKLDRASQRAVIDAIDEHVEGFLH